MAENKRPVKQYPMVGACGLDCGLCPMHHSAGTSRCPGCCGPDFFNKHPTCPIITCAVKTKGLETCAECPDWEKCEKIGRRMNSPLDSVISYRPIRANFVFIREKGMAEFARLETEKVKLLDKLIAAYDDGRSKRFYCTACQLLPPDRLKAVVKVVKARIPPTTGIKEKAGILREAITFLANDLQVDLKLRK